MYSRASLDELDGRDIDGIEPDLKPVGLALKPDEMRPSVWTFAEGDSNNRHRQDRQEELYLVLDGRFEMDVEDETFEVGEGEFVVVDTDDLESQLENQLLALNFERFDLARSVYPLQRLL
jgi:gentisate 1,2-dioxygenase